MCFFNCIVIVTIATATVHTESFQLSETFLRNRSSKVKNDEETTFRAQTLQTNHPLSRQPICPIPFGVCSHSALAHFTI